MIDTNKYEGHTPAPWRVVKPSQANATGHIWCIESATEIDYSPDHYTRVAHICVIHNEDDDTINAELIADAPLLLEAYKRLREKNDLLRSMQKDGIEASAHDRLLLEINHLREDNEKLHDAINRSFHAKISGSALEIYNGWWEGEEE